MPKTSQITQLPLEAVSDAIVVVDSEGQIIQINTQSEKLFGYSREELLGRSVEILIPARFRSQHLQHRAEFFTRPSMRPIGRGLDLWGLSKDGREFPVEISLSPFQVKGELLVTAAIRDITERKRAEETIQFLERQRTEAALRESEERFRQLVEHLDEVFWMSTADGSQVLYVSPAYEKVRGHPCQRIYEHPTDWVDAIHPEDRPRLQDVHARITEGEFSEEYRIIRPDKTIRWIWSRGFPIREASGKVERIAGIAQDITERKEAEEKLRQQQAELAHMARFALAGEMASGLAHELNQPLGAIKTYTEACLLLIHSGQIKSGPLVETMEKVAAQAQRAGNIIHRLRNLMRKVEAHRSAVNINQLIEEVILLLEPETRQQEVQIRLKLDETLPSLFADGIQIQQVILNLARNAIESMSESQARPRVLTLRTAPAKCKGLEVCVADTGPGLSSEEMERLFMPFFTTKSTGMGLGLSISQSIISAHKGHLWVTRNPDRGVTFCFILPYELRESPR